MCDCKYINCVDYYGNIEYNNNINNIINNKHHDDYCKGIDHYHNNIVDIIYIHKYHNSSNNQDNNYFNNCNIHNRNLHNIKHNKNCYNSNAINDDYVNNKQ